LNGEPVHLDKGLVHLDEKVVHLDEGLVRSDEDLVHLDRELVQLDAKANELDEDENGLRQTRSLDNSANGEPSRSRSQKSRRDYESPTSLFVDRLKRLEYI